MPFYILGAQTSRLLLPTLVSIKNVYAECESAIVIKSESEELVQSVTLRDFRIKPIWFDVEKHMDFFSIKNVGNLICDELRTVDGKVIE